MTTIIIDGPRKTVYADVRTTISVDDENSFLIGDQTDYKDCSAKIIEYKNRADGVTCLFTGCGSVRMINQLKRQIISGNWGLVHNRDRSDSASCFVIREDGDSLNVINYILVHGFFVSRWEVDSIENIKNNALFVGSGSSHAAGAYTASEGDPKKTFKAVNMFDSGTSSKFNGYRFGKGFL